MTMEHYLMMLIKIINTNLSQQINNFAKFFIVVMLFTSCGKTINLNKIEGIWVTDDYFISLHNSKAVIYTSEIAYASYNYKIFHDSLFVYKNYDNISYSWKILSISDSTLSLKAKEKYICNMKRLRFASNFKLDKLIFKSSPSFLDFPSQYLEINRSGECIYLTSDINGSEINFKGQISKEQFMFYERLLNQIDFFNLELSEQERIIFPDEQYFEVEVLSNNKHRKITTSLNSTSVYTMLLISHFSVAHEYFVLDEK